MAFSIVEFEGDNIQTDFIYNKGFIAEAHVIVNVDNVLSILNGAGALDYIFFDSQTIRFNTAPGAGAQIRITRDSSQAIRIVNYTDASPFDDQELNTDSKQAFFMAQEALDIFAVQALTFDVADDRWDFQNRQGKNLADGTEDDHLVNKSQLDAAQIAAGNVPTPDNPGDDFKVLQARAGLFDFEDPAALTMRETVNTPTTIFQILDLGAVSFLDIAKSGHDFIFGHPTSANDADLLLRGPDAQAKTFYSGTGAGAIAAARRFGWGITNEAETGGGAGEGGSNWELNGFNNSGALIDTPLRVVRATAAPIEAGRGIDVDPGRLADQPAVVPLIIRGSAAQSVNLLEVRDNGGTLLNGFTSAGVLITGPPSLFPDGLLDDATITNDVTDSDHDIDFAPGAVADTTNTTVLRLTSTFIKQLDAAWVVGTNMGGLFSGAIAADTWYHCFFIEKDSDGSIDCGFDTSVTAANIPVGYTKFRRIGSIFTDGASNILGFKQHEDRFLFDSPILDVNTTQGTAAVLYTLSTPLDIVTEAMVNFFTFRGGNQPMVYLSSPESDDLPPSLVGAPLMSIRSGINSEQDGHQARVWTNTSSQVRARGDQNSITFRVATFGWIDRRI